MEKLGLYIEEVNEKTTQNNQYEVLTSSQGGIVSQEDYFNKQVASTDNIGYKIIRKGQFTYRSMSDTGRFYINRLTNKEVGIVSPAYPVFKIASDKIMPEYLSLFFQSEYFQGQISNKASGSTRLALRYSKLENVEIDITAKEKQEEIVKNIDSIKKAIEVEEKEQSILDELIKSRFIELFGNIIDNDRCWNTSKLNEVCDVRDGTHDSPKYVSEGYPFVTSKNITNGELDFSNVQYISKVDYLHFEERSHVDDGDILMPMIGTVGGAVIVKKDREFSIKNVCLIKFSKTNNVLNTYIKYVLNSDEMNLYFDSLKKGGNQPFIGLNTIRSLMIPIPPKNVQYDFVFFVNQVDKLKFFRLGRNCHDFYKNMEVIRA